MVRYHKRNAPLVAQGVWRRFLLSRFHHSFREGSGRASSSKAFSGVPHHPSHAQISLPAIVAVVSDIPELQMGDILALP